MQLQQEKILQNPCIRRELCEKISEIRESANKPFQKQKEESSAKRQKFSRLFIVCQKV